MRWTRWALMRWSAWPSIRSCWRSDLRLDSRQNRAWISEALNPPSVMLERKALFHPVTKGNGTMANKQSGIRLAKRLDEVGFSDIVQIRNKVMALRAEGLQVHALHGGEPFFETPGAIKY